MSETGIVVQNPNTQTSQVFQQKKGTRPELRLKKKQKAKCSTCGKMHKGECWHKKTVQLIRSTQEVANRRSSSRSFSNCSNRTMSLIQMAMPLTLSGKRKQPKRRGSLLWEPQQMLQTQRCRCTHPQPRNSFEIFERRRRNGPSTKRPIDCQAIPSN